MIFFLFLGLTVLKSCIKNYRLVIRVIAHINHDAFGVTFKG